MRAKIGTGLWLALVVLVLVRPAASADPVFKPATLPKATVGTPYKDVALQGGRGVWEAMPCPGWTGFYASCNSMLPKGMEVTGRSYDAESIQAIGITGTPQEAGTFKLTFNWYVPGIETPVSHTWTLVVEPAKPKGADLSVTVQGPEKVPKNDAATYTVVVQNKGPEDATNVRAIIGYADMTEVERVTSTRGTCTKKALSVECSLATLKVGAYMDIRVRVRPDNSGSRSVVGEITSATNDPDRLNNKVVRDLLVQGEADIAVVKTGPRSASDRDTVDWLIRVGNKGPDRTTIRLHDAAPPGVTFTRVFSTRPRACKETPSAVDCTFVELAKGEKVTITVRGRISVGPEVRTLRNAVSVETDDRDPLTRDNKAAAETRVD